jgi:hypothetical protein
MGKKYKCIFCVRTTFSSKFALQRHLESHLSKTDDEVRRNTINIEISRISPVKLEDKTFCEECNKDFFNKYSFVRHVKTTHDNTLQESQPVHLDLKKMTTRIEYVLPFNIISDKLGGKENAYKFLCRCIYARQRGDIDVINKLFLEGRDPLYYPIRRISKNPPEFEFYNEDGEWVQDNHRFVTILRSVVQDAYIICQNMKNEKHDMEKNLGNKYVNKFYKMDFSGHDDKYWADRLVEYSSEKYQNNLLKELSIFFDRRKLSNNIPKSIFNDNEIEELMTDSEKEYVKRINSRF